MSGPAWEAGGTALIVTATSGLEGQARQELRRLLPDARVRPLLLKGNLLLLTAVPEEQALARIGEGDTSCVAQVIPVQRRVPVGPSPGSFGAVADAVVDVGRLRPGDTFLVRCRRRGAHDWRSRDLERQVAAQVERATGAVGDYEGEVTWHVTVQVYQDVAYVGVNRPWAAVHKTPRRQRKYAPGERPLNRAQWKIKEALSAFGIEVPGGARVLDLGSAPGGWAAALAQAGARVVAVDPADLDPAVEALPNVEHLRCRAEDLVGRADLVGAFDLMTADMNVDPAQAATIVARLAPLLKPGASAILTIKYTTPHRRRHERDAQRILAAEYQDIRLRRLPHNARETTAAMRRREGGGAAERSKAHG